MQIRKANSADTAAIHQFICGLEDEQFDAAQFEKLYLQNIVLPNFHYLIALDEGNPIGYISCHGQVLLHHLGLVYEIQEMFVLPEYRSKGVGKLLLESLLALIDKEDYILLEVCSNMRRKDAHRFYEKNGFICTSYKFRRERT